MSSAFDELAAMVRQAEISANSEKLESLMGTAATKLREAREKNRDAQERLKEVRLARHSQLEEIELKREQLKEIVRKSAEYKSHIQAPNAAEDLIIQARKELDENEAEARGELNAAQAHVEQALTELREAMEEYESARVRLDELQPQLADEYADEDRIMKDAARFFPSGELRALEKEVNECRAWYGTLDRNEQYAQMKSWIGRLRRLQTWDLEEEEMARSRRLFPQLVGISKEYEPGYIEAFQQDFKADWDQFILEAERELDSATQVKVRRREQERERKEQVERDQEQKQQARESAVHDMDDLKAYIATVDLSQNGQDAFRDKLTKVMHGFGAADEELLELVMPLKDLIEGPEFRALRRNIEKLEQERSKDDDELAEEISDIVDATRGQKVVLIGGARREDVRGQLLRLFEFHSLVWEDYEGTKPAKLRSLEQRIRNRGIDMLLILKSFISHHVPEKLRPLCEQFEIPCLMIEHGYGASQVAAAIRKGLLAPKAEA